VTPVPSSDALSYDAGVEPRTRDGSQRPGALVISLDFELHWGVRDHTPLDEAERARLLAARACIPRILDLFEEFSVHATWAVVGLLFARSKEEAEAFTPEQPNYLDARLNPYREQLGTDERDDPFHFAPSLIAQIAARRGQEIASHSFAHYYCMEEGQTAAHFEADLKSAVAIAANSGYTVRSYVFPRNQVKPGYLASLERSGIRAYRGNESVGIKKAESFAEQRRPWKRIGRLLDSFMDMHGDQTIAWPDRLALTSIPASRYLRPYHPAFRYLEPCLLRRIRKAMMQAAEHGEIFHLWWHPEDFAGSSDENLRVLRRVLEMFDSYRAHCGMISLSMTDVLSRIDCDHSDAQSPSLTP
jgi:peptidoglycan/xylan/chitin deacetylase (PgdA/CDA1 family)